MSRLLLTGGAGFMGSQLARDYSAAGWDVVVFDRLTYAGRREHLADVPCRLVVGDVCDPRAVRGAMDGCEVVVHAAAESHVTRSLDEAGRFLQTNVEGTRVVLAAAVELGVRRVVHVSTDEVFGTAPGASAFEVDDRLRPGNPYAASKVGAEGLVHAWRHSFDLPVVMVRCTNNYGPRQHPEKAVPSWTRAAQSAGPEREPLYVDGDGTAIRDWIFVEDFSRAMVRVLERWQDGATWHFAGRAPMENRAMAKRIAALGGGAEVAFRSDRRGQDARYSLNDTATRAALDWAPRVGLDEGLARTMDWYRQHGDLWS